MADVFSQIYIQIVFAVKNRQGLIQPEWEEHLYQYATGVVPVSYTHLTLPTSDLV